MRVIREGLYVESKVEEIQHRQAQSGGDEGHVASKAMREEKALQKYA